MGSSVKLRKVLDESKQSYVEITRDQFEQGKQIGLGTYAKVYEGKFQSKPAAIKVPIIAGDEEAQDYLLDNVATEINNLMKLISPYIVGLKGICFDPMCLVFELMPNNSLDYQLTHHPSVLEKHKRLQIMFDTAKALQVIHSTGGVYCDLKPGNVLLDANYLAVLADVALVHSNKQKSDAYYGSLCFLPKEVLESGHNTQAADVYSLGLVFCSLMCSDYENFQNVWDVFEPTLLAIEVIITSGLVSRRLMSLLKGVEMSGGYPASLVDLVRKCIQEDATKRPAIDEVIPQLQEIMSKVEGQSFQFFRRFKRAAEVAAATTALVLSPSQDFCKKSDFSGKLLVKS